MSPIKDFKLDYVAPNKENFFFDGDTVTGKITFVLKEQTKVKGVVVKVKGEARVHWTDGTGDRRRTHSDYRRYFKDKVRLVEEGKTLPESFTGLKGRQVDCSRTRTSQKIYLFCDNRHLGGGGKGGETADSIRGGWGVRSNALSAL